MPASPDLSIVIAGHVCLDMFPKFSGETPAAIAEVFRPGKLIHMGSMAFSTGGCVANAGIAMKKFGADVKFVAKVGDDTIGRLTREILSANGSAEGVGSAQGEGSSYTVVLAPAGIDRIFLHCPGTNDTFTAADIDFGILRGARLFHFGYPTLMRMMFSDGGDEVGAIFDGARATGATTSLDISMPDPQSPAGKADWPGIYRKVLPHTDIFVPSIEEAYFTLHPREYQERKTFYDGEELIDYLGAHMYSRIAVELLGYGCGMVALKAGHNGWYVRTGSESRLGQAGRGAPAEVRQWANRELWCPAFCVERIASATGSGDSSIAAFLVSLLRGNSVEQCLKFANAAGCMNLSALDATSGLGSWQEMSNLIATATTRDVTVMPADGWEWREQTGVWEKIAE